MGSIANTLNSINTSLLQEIGSYLSPSQTSSGANANPTTATAAPDSANLSEVGQLFQGLQKLESTNPTDFKKVAADAAAQFQQAAQQAADPTQASFLSNLANKFQQAAASGNLSAFQQNGSQQTTSSSGHHGHHHGHGGGSPATNSSTTQNPLWAILGITPSTRSGGTQGSAS
jgi:hypothetical protein